MCLPACVYVYHASTWCPWRPEEDTGFPRTGVIGAYELPCGYWTFCKTSNTLSHSPAPPVCLLVT